MIKLTDGIKTIEISMQKMDNGSLTPDFSADFFEVGSLPYDEERDVYKVDDVDYCIDYANDWKNGTGDAEEDPENWMYCGDSYEDGERRMKKDIESRTVFVKEI